MHIISLNYQNNLINRECTTFCQKKKQASCNSVTVTFVAYNLILKLVFDYSTLSSSTSIRLYSRNLRLPSLFPKRGWQKVKDRFGHIQVDCFSVYLFPKVAVQSTLNRVTYIFFVVLEARSLKPSFPAILAFLGL